MSSMGQHRRRDEKSEIRSDGRASSGRARSIPETHQKCRSFMIWGRNWVRKVFASCMGWMSSTTRSPRGAMRGNQKKTVWTICTSTCAPFIFVWTGGRQNGVRAGTRAITPSRNERERDSPSSTTIRNGGASVRFISFVQTSCKKSTSLASPQCNRFSSRYSWYFGLSAGKFPQGHFPSFRGPGSMHAISIEWHSPRGRNSRYCARTRRARERRSKTGYGNAFCVSRNDASLHMAGDAREKPGGVPEYAPPPTPTHPDPRVARSRTRTHRGVPRSLEEADLQKLERVDVVPRVRPQPLLVQRVVVMAPRPTLRSGAARSGARSGVPEAPREDVGRRHLVRAGGLPDGVKVSLPLPGTDEVEPGGVDAPDPAVAAAGGRRRALPPAVVVRPEDAVRAVVVVGGGGAPLDVPHRTERRRVRVGEGSDADVGRVPGRPREEGQRGEVGEEEDLRQPEAGAAGAMGGGGLRRHGVREPAEVGGGGGGRWRWREAEADPAVGVRWRPKQCNDNNVGGGTGGDTGDDTHGGRGARAATSYSQHRIIHSVHTQVY